MICLKCKGSKKIFSVFPAISILCETCHGSGEIDGAFQKRIEEGNILKEERKKLGLSLRDYCLLKKINPIQRSNQERGIA